MDDRLGEDGVMEYVFGPVAYPFIWLGHALDRLQRRFPVTAPFMLLAAVFVLLAVGCMG